MKKIEGGSSWKEFQFYKLFQIKQIVIKRKETKLKEKTN